MDLRSPLRDLRRIRGRNSIVLLTASYTGTNLNHIVVPVLYVTSGSTLLLPASDRISYGLVNKLYLRFFFVQFHMATACISLP